MTDPDLIDAPDAPKREFAHLSRAELIMTAVKFVKRECLAREPELFLSCWPAYRGMSPWRRNIEFAREAKPRRSSKAVNRREQRR